MRRWNGWGDQSKEFPLNEHMKKFLSDHAGPGSPPRDAGLEEILAAVPPGRLPGHPLITDDPEARLRHARGQSLPDWVALRSGRIGSFPDGVAFPQSSAEVRELVDFAVRNNIVVIPYGGGTSVVGHINATGVRPSLTVDMGRMNRLLDLDPESHLATFQAGVRGPDLEARLREHGYTLGHYPQSFEYSTLGGWVASRSSGQQSLGYGRIEQLFAGGRLETPRGSLKLPAFPASAAGPDLRELVLGSEGRFGILTEVAVRVRLLPEAEEFSAIFFPDFTSGIGAVRELARRRLPLVMLRLSTAVETATTLAMSGKQKLIGWLDKYLSLRGIKRQKCLMIYGAAGSRSEVAFAGSELGRIVRRHGGVAVGRAFGREWHKNRFKTPYLRNTLWEAGYAVDTLETAVPWSRVENLEADLTRNLGLGLRQAGEKVHVFSHLSHVYKDGCSIYTTFVFRLADSPEETLARWRSLKKTASETILAHGGTISHQHGVGVDHKEYLPAEKGPLGMDLLRGAGLVLDPAGVMNEGKLY
ncbi:MAG: FAD-binding oxidoreductase [Peptococcaceae bacterium]|nr:FAD-binding oxidoreductase [Peptococcaceae bacterium]